MPAPSKEVRIAIDAMGGDLSPEINIEGSLQALEESRNLHVILVGKEDVLKAELLKRKKHRHSRLEIVHAESVITMDDHASDALRKKKDSSIHRGLKLVADREADAFISAGHSGAVMAASLLILGRLPEVERPAIIVKLPTTDGSVLLLDVGANVDCRPQNLVQFAEMGSVYAQILERLPTPRVALLSNGSEAHKGNDLTRKAHALLLERKQLNYRGSIEGFDLFRGLADVVVCDGFVGNVTLKLSEGLADTAFQWFRSHIQKDVLGLVGVLLLKGILRKFRKTFDYQPYGAAPLLGIDGMVWISHGSSTDVAIRNGILNAQKAVEEGLLGHVAERLKSLSAANNTAGSKGPTKK